MSLHRDDDLLNPDEEPARFSRRGLLRRSVYGVTGIGLASLLAACGGDDDDNGDDGDDNPSGVEDVDERPDPEDTTGEGAEEDEEG